MTVAERVFAPFSEVDMNKNHIRPTQERLRELLDYAPSTGILTWRVRVNSMVPAGMRAGTLNTASGYRYISVDKNSTTEHRVIWCWMTGEWPPSEVDHKNRVRNDNKWENLRLASESDNKGNRPPFPNKTGFPGVKRVAAPYLKRECYSATVTRGNVKKYLGVFDTPEEAHAAYVTARNELYGEFVYTALPEKTI